MDLTNFNIIKVKKKEKTIKLDYSNLGKCLEKMLEEDRNDWDKFHENFVKILVDFGYRYCLTTDENRWLEDIKINGECISITDYTNL